MLTENSDYEAYSRVADFPSPGAVDTFYLDRSSQDPNEESQYPSTGNLYLWNGSGYEFYCDLANTSFVGIRPAHPPHHN